MNTETAANVAATESPHERATRKTLGYLVLLCCAILCMLGLMYYNLKISQQTPQARARATPTLNLKPPALPRPLSA